MTADLVKRLRGWLDEDVPIGVIMNEAAARIAQLEAALREIAYFEISSSVGDIYGDTQKEWLEAFDRAQSVARAALAAPSHASGVDSGAMEERT